MKIVTINTYKYNICKNNLIINLVFCLLD